MCEHQDIPCRGTVPPSDRCSWGAGGQSGAVNITYLSHQFSQHLRLSPEPSPGARLIMNDNGVCVFAYKVSKCFRGRKVWQDQSALLLHLLLFKSMFPLSVISFSVCVYVFSRDYL